MWIPRWALENRFALSLLVAGIVAAYGARALRESADAAVAKAGVQTQDRRKGSWGAVLRLFFVTFAATYVIAYTLERLRPSHRGSWGARGGGGGQEMGGQRGGGGPALDVLMSHVDMHPPSF